MDEYIIYDVKGVKIAETPPNANWIPIKLRVLGSTIGKISVFICKFEEKILIKMSEKYKCCKPNCDGPKYGYHNTIIFQHLFKCDFHCNNLPADRVMDITDVMIFGNLAETFIIKRYSGKIVPTDESNQLSNWQRHLFVTGCESAWILFHTKQNGKDYLKACIDVFSCNECIRQPGYHNVRFKTMFGCDLHCKNFDFETVVDATGLIVPE
jgi:hypothetical protein